MEYEEEMADEENLKHAVDNDDIQYDLEDDFVAKSAFETLLNAARRPLHNKDTMTDNPDRAWLPPCLQAQKGPYYPCMVCGLFTRSVESAISHSKFHSNPYVNDGSLSEMRDLNARTCTFCGKCFSTQIVLSLHQMSERLHNSCTFCGDIFDDPQDESVHVCPKFPCPPLRGGDYVACQLCTSLAGTYQKHHKRDGIREHLTHFHGCENFHFYIFEGHLVLMDNTAFDSCLNCNALINSSKISFERHCLFHCPARSSILRECARSIKDVSIKSGIDALTLFRMEVESIIKSLDKVELEEYLSEPGLSEEYAFEMFSPFTVIKMWEKNIESSLLAGLSKKTQRLLPTIYRMIRDRLAIKKWHESDYEDEGLYDHFDDAGKPKDSVFKKLTEELGFDPTEQNNAQLLQQAGFQLSDEFQKLIK